MHGTKPGKRSDHVAQVYDKQMFIFGGWNPFYDRNAKTQIERLNTAKIYNDVWSLDLLHYTWKKIKTSDIKPSGRDSLASTVHKNQLVIFGGWLGNDLSNATGSVMQHGGAEGAVHLPSGEAWALDLNTYVWKKLGKKTVGAVPPGRFWPSIVAHNDKMYMYGGGKGSAGKDLDTITWVLDFNTDAWTRVKTTGPVTARQAHSAVIYNDNMVIWGGFNYEGDKAEKTSLSDIWSLDLITYVWKELPSTNVPLKFGQSALDGLPTVYNSKIISVMGMYGLGYENDGENHNEVYTYDLVTFEWRQLETSSPKPVPRGMCHPVLYDGKVVMFGGNINLKGEPFDYWPLPAIDDVLTLDLIPQRAFYQKLIDNQRPLNISCSAGKNDHTWSIIDTSILILLLLLSICGGGFYFSRNGSRPRKPWKHSVTELLLPTVGNSRQSAEC